MFIKYNIYISWLKKIKKLQIVWMIWQLFGYWHVARDMSRVSSGVKWQWRGELLAFGHKTWLRYYLWFKLKLRYQKNKVSKTQVPIKYLTLKYIGWYFDKWHFRISLSLFMMDIHKFQDIINTVSHTIQWVFLSIVHFFSHIGGPIYRLPKQKAYCNTQYFKILLLGMRSMPSIKKRLRSTVSSEKIWRKKGWVWQLSKENTTIKL